MQYLPAPCPFTQGCAGTAHYHPILVGEENPDKNGGDIEIVVTRTVTMQCDNCGKTEVVVFDRRALPLDTFIELPTIDALLIAGHAEATIP